MVDTPYGPELGADDDPTETGCAFTGTGGKWLHINQSTPYSEWFKPPPRHLQEKARLA